jgi:prolyl oligopeptidase
VDAAGTEIEEDKFAKLYYHKLGTSQGRFSFSESQPNLLYSPDGNFLCLDDDILVMKDDDHPNYMWGTQVTSPDGRYLILYVSRDTARVCGSDRLRTAYLTNRPIAKSAVGHRFGGSE